MGCDESDFYSSYEKLLLQLLSGGDDDREELAISALFALSILSFVTSVDSQATIWDLCEDFLCGEAESTYNSPELKARAAECWVLLAIAAATGEGELVLERSRRRVFEALVELLDESAGSTEIRITAGRVIAFLWETAAEVSGDPSASAIDLGRLLCNHSSMVEQLLRSLQDVVRESSKRISKKDRKEQRSEFRDIEDWVVKGDPPSDTVRMAGVCIYFCNLIRHRKSCLCNSYSFHRLLYR